jgi:hypothetical protein
MPWDFLRDPFTGDWKFSGDRDYAGVTGEMLIQQRVSINLKIPRGSFVYDTEKSLGSRLYDLLATDFERGLRDAPDIVREALDGMTDIQVDEIQVLPDDLDPRQIRIRIMYHSLVPIDFSTAPIEGGVVEAPFGLREADLTPPSAETLSP